MASNLPVVERFHSLQGEGAHSGRSAFFIRLAGCTVGCPWCDTKDSWATRLHPSATVLELSKEVEVARAKGAAFVVITGGEPLHHNLNFLCDAIQKTTSSQASDSIPIHIETSGVDKLTGTPNWITLSPKRHAPPRAELLAACHEIKVVINEESDVFFAEEIAKQANNLKSNSSIEFNPRFKNSTKALLFLQPAWNSPEGTKLAVDYVKQNAAWTLSVQTHKWLDIL